jgi:hypothetical protein
MGENACSMSRDFDAFFTRLVTDSLSRSAAGEARRAADGRVAPRVRSRLAARRSVDRRRIVQLLEREPDAVRGYLRMRHRARRASSTLWLFGGGCLAAALSLGLAAAANGASGAWVAYSDAALTACGIVACFAYVMLVSARTTARRRLRVLDDRDGQERRAGRDRRRPGAGYPPAGIERRSGIDRRILLARGWSE